MLRISRLNFNNIDCIKVCMAVLVVATHTNLFSVISSIEWRETLINALAIKVPFFFAASGFLVWYKVWNASKEEQLLRLRKWLSKTFRLYLVWSLIYLPYAIYGFWLDGLYFSKALLVYCRNILLVGQNFWSWPLWYLLGMLVAGSIIYLMVKLDFKAKSMYLIAALFAVLGVFIDMMHGLGYCNLYFKLFLTTRNGFFEGLPYITVGIAIASCGVISSKKLLCVLLLCSFIVHMLGVKLATFFVIYALFSLVLQLDLRPREDDLYRNFRLTSTIIYFIHMLWVGLITLLYPEMAPYWMFILVLILSFATAYLVIRNKETTVVKLCFR